MLTVEDAWRLDRTSKTVRVSWDELRVRTRMPEMLGVARVAGGWTVRRALRLLQDADATPYKTKRRMVLQLLRFVLTPDQLWAVGYETHDIVAMRTAQKMLRGRNAAENARLKAHGAFR